MPLTLFCYLNSPDDAAAFLSEHGAIVEGGKDKWTATYVFPGKFLQKKKTVTFNYDREWCSPPNWPKQIQGMTNYIGNFQMEETTRFKVMRLIRQFEFAIGIVNEPETSKNDDPRFGLMQALAEYMQGCFFIPGAILDASFRAFAAADGDTTPGAVIPETGEENPPQDDTGDEAEPVPPTPERVGRRMYVMLALAARGLLDMNLQQGNTPAYGLTKLHEWFESLNIAGELEPREKEILYTAEQELSQQDCINCVWSLEALVVIAWALELTSLPPYDQLVETDELLKELSFLDVEGCKHKLSKASLRPGEDLDRYHEQIFAYDWRMVDYRVNAGPVDYANVKIGLKAFDLSWARLIDGDLALQGKRIDMAEPDLFGAMCSLAVERHKASNWLQGYAVRYSDISPDT